MHDYEEIFAEDDNRALLDPAYDYYTEIVNEADLSMMIICILTDCMSERMSAPAERIWLHFQMRRYRHGRYLYRRIPHWLYYLQQGYLKEVGGSGALSARL